MKTRLIIIATLLFGVTLELIVMSIEKQNCYNSEVTQIADKKIQCVWLNSDEVQQQGNKP